MSDGTGGQEQARQQAREARTMGNGALDGAVIAVAGAGGPAGRAALLRL
ncbi:short-chain dehydrogenase, partial [Streptomyces rochei]|nr:short-chain dehydrogenase [Streptomyces rochei]